MKWTNETPKVDGTYWHRCQPDNEQSDGWVKFSVQEWGDGSPYHSDKCNWSDTPIDNVDDDTSSLAWQHAVPTEPGRYWYRSGWNGSAKGLALILINDQGEPYSPHVRFNYGQTLLEIQSKNQRASWSNLPVGEYPKDDSQ